MKGFGKGLALFCVIVIVAAMLQLLIGFEEGGIQHGMAVLVGCIVAYFAAIRIDAIKPMIGLSIFMCVTSIGNLALGEMGAFFTLIGSVVTLIMSVVWIRNNR